MPTSIISQVINDNEEPFESQYGPLYSYTVHFEDGSCFKVNSKSATQPPWQVGQEWNYEAGKTFKGRTSATLSKPQFANQSNSRPNPAPAAPRAPAAPQTAQNRPQSATVGQRNGQRDGLCLKIAADILIAQGVQITADNLARTATTVEAGMTQFEQGGPAIKPTAAARRDEDKSQGELDQDVPF